MLTFSSVINPLDIEQKEQELLKEWHILAAYGNKTLSLCLHGCLYKVKQGSEEKLLTFNHEEAVKLFNSL